MSDYYNLMLALLDFEIEDLLMKKTDIDKRIAMLYERREDLIVEMEHQTQLVCDGCNHE